MTQKIRQNSLAELQEMAKNLKYVRLEILGLTQKDFAKRIHLSQGFISDLEREKKFPNGDFFVFLSKYLQINFYFLLSGKGNIFLLPKEFDLEKVEDRVKKVRFANGKTEKDFAENLNMELTRLVRIERGVIKPEYKELVMIHHVFKIDLKWLKSGQGIEPAKPLKALEEKNYFESIIESQEGDLKLFQEEVNRQKKEIEFLQELNNNNKNLIDSQRRMLKQQQELLQMKPLSNEVEVKKQVTSLKK